MTEPEHYENVDTIIDGLSRHFDSRELSAFMKSIGSITDSTLKGNVVLFLEFLNKRETKEEQQKLISDFDQLLLSNYLKKKNKIIGISYLGLTKGVFSENVNDFVRNYLNDKDEYLSIFNTYIGMGVFSEVYHKVESTKDGLKTFEIIYGRSYFRKDDDSHKRVELVKVDFDFDSNQVMFYLPYPVTAAGDIPHTTYGLFVQLREKIFEDFKVQVLNPDTDRQTFDIYKKYTENNEQEYVQKVNRADSSSANKTEEFYTEMLRRLDPDLLQSTDSQPYVSRIKRVFVRLMVDNYFDDFVRHIKHGNGYITGFIYTDNMGSSITGKNGTGQSLDDQEINPLQASETYLDTRDTIYSDGKLFSVRIHFQPLNIAMPFKYDVRILALDNLLVVHFIRSYVSEERKDYVFQQLESII
ncbi:hypothetical protein ACFE3Z_01865 [Lactiplantibacillus plantarum]